MVRLDGCCFSTYTKGFKRPYDLRVHRAMVGTATETSRALLRCTLTPSRMRSRWCFRRTRRPRRARCHSTRARAEGRFRVCWLPRPARFNTHMLRESFDENSEAALRERVERRRTPFRRARLLAANARSAVRIHALACRARLPAQFDHACSRRPTFRTTSSIVSTRQHACVCSRSVREYDGRRRRHLPVWHLRQEGGVSEGGRQSKDAGRRSWRGARGAAGVHAAVGRRCLEEAAAKPFCSHEDCRRRRTLRRWQSHDGEPVLIQDP